MTAKTYSAQDIDFKKTFPIFVVDLFKWLYFKDSRVVHQDVDVWKAICQLLYACGRSDVRGYATDFASNAGGPKLADRFVDPLFCPAIYNNGSAFVGERFCNRKPDTSRASRDHGQLTVQL
jgi:hypothetical protein